MSSKPKVIIRDCCDEPSVWIFLYSDRTVFTMCDEHFKEPNYRFGLIKVINIKTKEGFKPDEIFGDE